MAFQNGQSPTSQSFHSNMEQSPTPTLKDQGQALFPWAWTLQAARYFSRTEPILTKDTLLWVTFTFCLGPFYIQNSLPQVKSTESNPGLGGNLWAYSKLSLLLHYTKLTPYTSLNHRIFNFTKLAKTWPLWRAVFQEWIELTSPQIRLINLLPNSRHF